MQRYFATINDTQVFLNESDAHHLCHVMRAKKHDRIEIVYHSQAYLCEIQEINPLVIVMLSPINYSAELKKPVTLFYSLSKGEKNELVIQKAVELGATRIVLIKSSRCIVKMNNDDFLKKKKRFDAIIKEAAEQCHREILPEIFGVYDVNHIPNHLLADINYVAYEEEKKSNPNIDVSFESFSILIGPEGGFSKDEIASLNKQGFKNLSLGKRILRTETAAIYALSVIDYLLEK